MGLDISYYRDAALAPDVEVDGDGNPIAWDTYTKIYIEPSFPQQADDLVNGAIYSTGDGDGFRAGSYGGYGRWREQLAELAGYAERPDEYGHRHSAGAWASTEGPFWELICFSDCEGVIGPKTSAKLANDFAQYQDMAHAHPDSAFRSKYSLWRKAFETAALNGFVEFR